MSLATKDELYRTALPVKNITQDSSPLICDLSYYTDNGRRATVIIDSFPDESVSAWLKSPKAQFGF